MVHVSLLVDKDAILAGKAGLAVSGASADLTVKTSWAPAGVKLTVMGGRDQTGGPAGSLSVGFRFKGL